tara:strand:- start:1436 stop:1720 length:285 start_codon:yes stop_codon:yes gene_type:complete
MLQQVITSSKTYTREIPDPTEDEIAAEAAYLLQVQSDVSRRTRDNLLAESDWTQAVDSPLTDEKKAEWVTYRAALRNLPTDEDWPEPTWPTIPS